MANIVNDSFKCCFHEAIQDVDEGDSFIDAEEELRELEKDYKNQQKKASQHMGLKKGAWEQQAGFKCKRSKE